MRYHVLEMTIQYTKVTLKSWFQYKVDAILRSLAVFLRESTGLIVIYLTPLIGILLYLLSYGFWRISVRFYKSTGN